MVKSIDTGGIGYLEPLSGSEAWYWGTDGLCGGDLYEAEESYKMGDDVYPNRLIFVSYPAGHICEPIAPKAGQCFGRPAYVDGRIVILVVNFIHQQIQLIQWHDSGGETTLLAEIPLAEVADCYNLFLQGTPLTLSRQRVDQASIDFIYPEKKTITLGENEIFSHRRGDKLFFTTWDEAPGYHEEVVIRSLADGRVIKRIAGSMVDLPNGERWLLT